MNLKNIFRVFLVLFFIFFANTSFGKDIYRKVPAKIVQNEISTENLMNTYMKDMEHRIKSNWLPPEDSFKNKTVVTFKIMRDGTIKSSKISESSGDKQFDTDAIKAVQQTGKVAPLPNDILGEYIDITFTFERISYLIKKDRYNR
ncbi:TonB family protein [bacterium]|nr:TonB family protein [bacterium]